MKNIIATLALVSVLGLNAAAYFDGSVTGTTGPDSYKGSNIDLLIGSGDLAFEPSLKTYSFEANNNDYSYKTYALRVAKESEKYTFAGFAGATPEADNYSNKFAGADITFSLTPGSGGHSRLAGPGARGGMGGGQGITRIDVGAGIKHTVHTDSSGATDKNTGQTEATFFGGAKILMVNLSATFAAYKYGDEDSGTLQFVPGLNFVTGNLPKSSINVKLDLPGQPLVTPFLSYTGTKYKNGVKDSTAYLLGAYIDLNMVVANVGYQIFDNGGSKDSYVTLGAGVKF